MLFKKKRIEETVLKGKYLAGLLNESTYQDLMDKIAEDYKKQLEYEKERDEMYLLENTNIKSSLSDVIEHAINFLDDTTSEAKQIDESDFIV